MLGAFLCIGLLLVLAIVWSGLQAPMGLGPVGDISLNLVVFVATAAILVGLGWGTLFLVRRVPTWPTLILLGSGLAAYFLLRDSRDVAPYILLFLVLVGLAGWLGASGGRLAQVLQARRTDPDADKVRRRSVANALAALICCVLAGASALVIVQSDESMGAGTETLSGLATRSIPNPVEAGPHSVIQFTYGSGIEAHGRRPEYGRDVDFPSPTLDMRPLLPDFSGLQARLHRAHWGFGLETTPLNATVWLPEGEGPFPLVLLIHGVDHGEHDSELGFSYLGEVLASRGIAVVSTDMNFLDHPHIGANATEMPLRAWLALEHLRFLEDWTQADPTGPAGRMDLERIVLAGHSRGGEAAALAAHLNTLERFPANAAIPLSFGFSIRGVAALAPTDQLYQMAGEANLLEDLSYLVIHGSHDADVTSFMGSAQWQRTQLRRGSSAFKASVYVVGANHSGFNSRSGRRDQRGPVGLLLDSSRLLGPEAQRQMAAVFVSSFVEATLKDNLNYQFIFRDPRSALAWLPGTRYVTRFEDGFTYTVAGFQEDANPVTGTMVGTRIEGSDLTVWTEQELTLRTSQQPSQATRAVRISWNRERPQTPDPNWAVHLPDSLPDGLLRPTSTLRFSMGHQARSAGHPKLSVEVETADGLRASLDPSDFAPSPPREFPQLWRFRFLDRLTTGAADEVLQDYDIPLSAFRHVEPDLDTNLIHTVRFRFDRSPHGTVILDDIGFRMVPDPLQTDDRDLPAS